MFQRHSQVRFVSQVIALFVLFNLRPLADFALAYSDRAFLFGPLEPCTLDL